MKISSLIMKLTEFWCISDKGILFFHYINTTNSQKNDDFIAGFYSTLQSIFDLIMNERITFIRLDTTSLYFSIKNNCVFVLRTENTSYSCEPEKILDLVSDRFIDSYGSNLSNFSGDLSCFESFTPVLSKIIT